MSQRGKKQGPGAGNTVAVCTRLAQPVAEELGLQLWDVRFVKEGADWYLRFFIDREGGVTIDDCEEMSRRMDKLLDEAEAPNGHEAEQMDLFTDYSVREQQEQAGEAAHARERKLQEAMLGIKKRYGKNAILKGMNLEDGATAKERNQTIGGHQA